MPCFIYYSEIVEIHMFKRFKKKSSARKIKKASTPIRRIFPHEAHDFTVWLSENISVLEEFGLYLKVEGREANVNGYRIDLLCTDSHGNRVVIENQLEKTDHKHVGQFFLYLDSVQANTGIWITTEARPEHIALIKGQNTRTLPEYEYYLIEIDTISIDNSQHVPIFRKIVGPDHSSNENDITSQTETSVQRLEAEMLEPDFPSEDVPTIWCVYPQRNQVTYDLFTKSGVIGIGFSNLGDLRKIPPTYESVKEAWAKKNFFDSQRQISTFSSMFHRLANMAQTGDLVIYPPTWLERKIYVGRISGDYHYDRKTPHDYRHLRPVEWVAELERDEFSPEALKGIMVTLAFFQVQNQQFLAELMSKLNQI